MFLVIADFNSNKFCRTFLAFILASFISSGEHTGPDGDGREVGGGGVHSAAGVLCYCDGGGDGVEVAGDVLVSVLGGDPQPSFRGGHTGPGGDGRDVGGGGVHSAPGVLC